MTKTIRDQLIGIVGIGELGSAVAETIAGAGFNLIVYDIRPEAITGLEHTAAAGAASLAALANLASVISIIVFSDEQVHQVCEEIFDNAKQGTTIVVHSTVRPSSIIELAARGDALGIRVVDCPANGGSEGALRGKLTLMYGGDDKTLSYCQPMFDAIAIRTIHAGPVGAGVTGKLLNDMIALGSYALQLEAMQLGAGYGLTEDTVTTIVASGTGDSRGIRTWGRMDHARRARQAAGREGTYSTRKAFDEAIIAGEQLGIEFPVLAAASQTILAKLQARNSQLDSQLGENVIPPIPICAVCGFELAAPFRPPGSHPECHPTD